MIDSLVCTDTLQSQPGAKEIDKATLDFRRSISSAKHQRVLYITGSYPLEYCGVGVGPYTYQKDNLLATNLSRRKLSILVENAFLGGLYFVLRLHQG